MKGDVNLLHAERDGVHSQAMARRTRARPGDQVDRDRIDEFVEHVVQQWPAIDPQVEAAVDRIDKINRYLDKALADHVGEHGINTGEFRTLLRLRLAGPPHRLSPGEISRHLDLSTGAMTNRLDGLEGAGLVVRRP